jgi:nicotinamide phosphoribosyltransferase
VACVSDSFNIWNACTEYWGGVPAIKSLLVTAFSSFVQTVATRLRLSSKFYELLGEKFGSTKNAKGFSVLHPKVRVIQGDGIDPKMLVEVLKAVKSAGWSADNIAFGSGGGLLLKDEP